MSFLQGLGVLLYALIIASSYWGVIVLGLLFPLILPWVLLVMLALVPLAVVWRLVKGTE